jgi:4'-phosphopantetheinyl transferase
MTLSHVIWSGGPERPSLAGGEIHVWATSLEDESPTRVEHLESLLAPSERARAERFRFRGDAHRFVISRATLRLILSRYLGSEPDRIQFSYSTKGKPVLSEPDFSHLKFNLSRSHKLGLYAIACDVNVGVDVERIVPDIEVDQIADRAFSLAERASICKLEGAKKIEALYDGWVSKEALLKATGEGLATGLDSSLKPCTSRGSNWFVRQFDIASGYKAALAVECSSRPVTSFYWFRHDHKTRLG